MKTTNWGIIGTGRIATTVVGAINFEENSKFYAVLSRSKEKAESFMKEYGGEKSYSDIIKFCNDKRIDAVYIATPHSEHFNDMKACLEAGIPVLCEKPMTVTAKETEEIIKIAKEKKVFLMEGMWTKFLPTFKKTEEWIRSGKIGEVKKVNTSICFTKEYDIKDRLFAKELAGGARLDIGVYTTHYTTQFMGFDIEKLNAITTTAPNGVDLQDMFSLKFKNGGLANMTVSIKDFDCNNGEIIGTKGKIYSDCFWYAREINMVLNDGTKEKFSCDFPFNGYEFEIEEVCKCINEGKLESDTVPLEMTLQNMRVLDKLKAAIDENK